MRYYNKLNNTMCGCSAMEAPKLLMEKQKGRATRKRVWWFP